MNELVNSLVKLLNRNLVEENNLLVAKFNSQRFGIGPKYVGSPLLMK